MSAAERLAEWNRLATSKAELQTRLPLTREALDRSIQADKDYFRKNAAHLADLTTERKQAEGDVGAIEFELAKLPGQLEELVAGVESAVELAASNAVTRWIQAKALVEVLAPELGDAVRTLECHLSRLQGEVSTPGRATGQAWLAVDAAFAHMLAEARDIVVHLIYNNDEREA